MAQAEQPIANSPAAASKPVLSWTERTRASALDVQRYTRFVGIMKRALPMAAAALLAAVLAYSLQPRLQNNKQMALIFKKLHIVNNDLSMMSPTLTGTDGQGNPYVVTAKEAIQDLHDPKRAQLKEVQADITLKKGDWLNLTATRGALDQSSEKLWLRGVIDVFSDNGYEMHTTAADIDMNTGTVVGNVPADGQGPLGTFRADRFRIDRGDARDKNRRKHEPKDVAKRDTTKIFLYGHVQMTIYKHLKEHS